MCRDQREKRESQNNFRASLSFDSVIFIMVNRTFFNIIHFCELQNHVQLCTKLDLVNVKLVISKRDVSCVSCVFCVDHKQIPMEFVEFVILIVLHVTFCFTT